MEYATIFFKQMWDIVKNDMLDIINNMHMEGSVSDVQKHGHIICLPKTGDPASPENYRPLTILNTDYKLLTRIIVNRLRPWMKDILHHNQYCWRNGQTVFDAVATVRDIIAYAEGTNKPICLLSIDFKDAFDKMSYAFLFKILREYRISEKCSRLQKIYADATSTLTLNGHKSTPIKIRSGVRRGCPLSMLLFALCINPLLINLDKKRNGIYIRHNSTKTTAVAYADDITSIVTQPEEMDTIKETLQDYMHATGACISANNSRAIALGSWNKSTPVMDIKYHDDIKLLGFHVTTNVQESAKNSWAMLTAKIRAQVQNAYHRALNLEHRISYVLLARAWFTTQIFPPLQITSVR